MWSDERPFDYPGRHAADDPPPEEFDDSEDEDEEHDGQPTWEQEWEDFGETYDDESHMI